MRRYLLLFLPLLFACDPQKESSEESILMDSVFTTPLGKTFEISAPSEKLLSQYEEAKANFEANPEDCDVLRNVYSYLRWAGCSDVNCIASEMRRL
jgi:hypothetical protein